MMDGEVTLSEKDMYFTGGTIIFDHGHGKHFVYAFERCERKSWSKS